MDEMKFFYLFVVMLILSTNLCFASSLGVSPANREVTVEAGKNGYAQFQISGSLDGDDFIKVTSNHPFIKSSEIKVIETPKMINLEIYVPKEVVIGVYEAHVLVCVTKGETDLTALGCVQTKITISVIEPTEDYSNVWISFYILTSVLIIYKKKKIK